MLRLRMRFGVTDTKLPRHLSIERSIAEVFIHPKHQQQSAHYDVGVAVAGYIIFEYRGLRNTPYIL